MSRKFKSKRFKEIRFKSIIFSVMMLFFMGCNDFHSKDKKLEYEIIKNVRIPFEELDTVIFWGFINFSKIESNDNYTFYSKEKYHLETLNTNHENRKIISVKEVLEGLLGQEYFMKNKVAFTLSGEIINKDSIKIIESYLMNEDFRVIRAKLYVYDSGKWKNELLLED